VLDGTHAAIMAKTLKTCFENPFEFFDSLEGRSTATANESLED